MNKLSYIFLKMIAGYRVLLSVCLPPCCRFEPSCSRYATEAIQKHGPWRGLGLTARRILRCHPWQSGGWDPVPK